MPIKGNIKSQKQSLLNYRTKYQFQNNVFHIRNLNTYHKYLLEFKGVLQQGLNHLPTALQGHPLLF